MGMQSPLPGEPARADDAQPPKKSGGEPLEVDRRGRQAGLYLHVLQTATHRAPQPVPGLRLAVHAFQGRTVDTLIAAMEANHPHLTNQKTLYVAISRARHRAELVTDDAKVLLERLEAATGERIAALETLARDKAGNRNAVRANEALQSGKQLPPGMENTRTARGTGTEM